MVGRSDSGVAWRGEGLGVKMDGMLYALRCVVILLWYGDDEGGKS